MTKCAQITEQLSAYLDGIMTAEEKRLIEEHLSTCEHCSLSLSELIKTQETLHNLEEVEPPPWFTQKIMNRVREEAEPKKGLLQRLFYPLHIKLPVEALATCLVVVLALFVYKNTEPEMKALHEPENTVTVSPQDQTLRQSSGVSSAPKEIGVKSDSPARTDNTGAGGLKKDTPSPAGFPERQMAEKSHEGAMKKQETMPMQKADAALPARLKEDSIASTVGSATVKDTPETMKALAAREIQARSAIEPKQVLFTVLTNNIESTTKETESLLNRFGAKNIIRTSRQPDSMLLGADLPGQKITEFFDALKTVGGVKGKEIPARSPEDYLAVRIEIMGNP
jgi:hypothetical protein